MKVFLISSTVLIAHLVFISANCERTLSKNEILHKNLSYGFQKLLAQADTSDVELTWNTLVDLGISIAQSWDGALFDFNQDLISFHLLDHDILDAKFHARDGKLYDIQTLNRIGNCSEESLDNNATQKMSCSVGLGTLRLVYSSVGMNTNLHNISSNVTVDVGTNVFRFDGEFHKKEKSSDCEGELKIKADVGSLEIQVNIQDLGSVNLFLTTVLNLAVRIFQTKLVEMVENSANDYVNNKLIGEHKSAVCTTIFGK